MDGIGTKIKTTIRNNIDRWSTVNAYKWTNNNINTNRYTTTPSISKPRLCLFSCKAFRKRNKRSRENKQLRLVTPPTVLLCSNLFLRALQQNREKWDFFFPLTLLQHYLLQILQPLNKMRLLVRWHSSKYSSWHKQLNANYTKKMKNFKSCMV